MLSQRWSIPVSLRCSDPHRKEQKGAGELRKKGGAQFWEPMSPFRVASALSGTNPFYLLPPTMFSNMETMFTALH